jgi:hypothetical protein
MGQGSQKVKTANGKIAVAFEEVTNWGPYKSLKTKKNNPTPQSNNYTT